MQIDRNTGDIILKSYLEVVESYSEEQANSLEIGKFSIVREGSDVAILACGVMVQEALDAATSLQDKGISATVVDVHTIKPLDKHALYEIANRCGAIVTAEDHNVVGGLGSAVAEALVTNVPTPVEFVGVADTFGQSGQADELLQEYSINSHAISDAVSRVLTRK